MERKKNFLAPFVKDSPIQMACKYLNEYHIKENDTILIDWDDLNEAFIQFKNIYKNKLFDELINNDNKQILIYRLIFNK